MENRRNSRNLKQTRAFNTKEKISETAYKLFCEKGYYKTTSIQIAKTAGVSIGCFYSYFKNKDVVFLEILDLYNRDFLQVTNEISDMLEQYKKDKKGWLLSIINKLIDIHEASKDLNKELSTLYNSNPTVASVLDEQHNKIKRFIIDFLKKYKSDVKVDDIDAAAIIAYDIIDSIVNRIVFDKKDIEPDRILQAGIEALNKYLFE
ncbi:TetR/AcrR family transcriptional regulator [Clostridium estertheticum]|nr:TetR/AcrR family transcriptional regulator [Clostridium estertheticum]